MEHFQQIADSTFSELLKVLSVNCWNSYCIILCAKCVDSHSCWKYFQQIAESAFSNLLKPKHHFLCLNRVVRHTVCGCYRQKVPSAAIVDLSSSQCLECIHATWSDSTKDGTTTKQCTRLLENSQWLHSEIVECYGGVFWIVIWLSHKNLKAKRSQFGWRSWLSDWSLCLWPWHSQKW